MESPEGVSAWSKSDRADEEGSTLHLLGRFRLESRGRPVALCETAQRLVAILALEGPLPRRAAAGRLWPKSTEARAQGNLRSTLWRIARKTDILIVEASRIGLAPTVEVDVNLLETEIRSLTSATGPDPYVGTSRYPSVLRRCELLPEWDDDWVMLERERLRQLQMHALEELATLWAGAGSYRDALDAALRAVSIEPLRESPHRIVIKIHLEEGNVVEATRYFHDYCKMLRRELGVAPTPRMLALFRSAPSYDSEARHGVRQ